MRYKPGTSNKTLFRPQTPLAVFDATNNLSEGVFSSFQYWNNSVNFIWMWCHEMLFMTCAILWCMLHGGQIMVSFDSDLHCYEAPPSKAAISRHFSPRWLPCAKTAVILWFQSAGHFRISNFWRSIYKFHLLSNFACLFHVYIIKVTHFSFS